MNQRKRAAQDREDIGIDAGDKVIRMRVKSESRDQYKSILNRFECWLVMHEPNLVTRGEILLPLPMNVVEEYLVYASLERTKHLVALDPPQYNTFATINGCKSALKYLS